MNTTNPDVTTLAAALATALKPLQKLQEQQLAMLTLNTLYTPEEVQTLRKEYEALTENIREILAVIREKTHFVQDNDSMHGDDITEAKRYLFNDAPGLRAEAFDKLAEFKRSNPLFTNALNIGNLYR